MKVLRWTVVLGITGFLSGFIGPMILAPDANQGPLLGILITGPTGALLGSVLGVAAALAKLSPRSEARALAATTAIVALVTLYFCVPSPRLRATVVEGEVRSCVPAESLRAATVDRLNRLAAARPVPEQVAWAKKFDEELAAKPGVVIGVHVYRDAQLVRKAGPLEPRNDGRAAVARRRERRTLFRQRSRIGVRGLSARVAIEVRRDRQHRHMASVWNRRNARLEGGRAPACRLCESARRSRACSLIRDCGQDSARAARCSSRGTLFRVSRPDSARRPYWVVKPPSIVRIEPVVNCALSLAR